MNVLGHGKVTTGKVMRLATLAAVAMGGAACGSTHGASSGTVSSPAVPAPAARSATSAAAPGPLGSATATMDMHSDNSGGLEMARPIPTGPNHPQPMTAQELYKLGEATTFAITGRYPNDYNGFGTAILVDKAGGMGITNAHVVQGLTAIKGRFNDGTQGSLHVIATDPCTDLAVVHFSEALPPQMQAITIGSSGDVQPGDQVTVLGYPASLADFTKQKLLITEGLVQATKVVAQPPGSPEYRDTIQHGATVNHGNSGGPLLDHHGRLVGINTLTALQGNAEAPIQGQYYSIAIDSAKQEIIGKLLKGQSENDMGWALQQLYPTFFQELDPTEGKPLDQGLQQAGIKGLYIADVAAGTGAARAGIRPGDVVTKIQNTTVRTPAEVCDVIESVLPGTTISVDGLYLYSNKAKFGRPWHAEFTAPGKH